jgi:ribosomal protein L11 methyltransferase
LQISGFLGCQETEQNQDVKIVAYFRDTASRDQALRLLQDFTPADAPRTGEIPDQDWNATWRASIRPVLIAPGIWVSPSWLPPPEKKAADQWIRIEPKMAFGSGHHETTRLAAHALIDLGDTLRDSAILDVGTGSGILCFAAGLQRARHCVGIDIDPVCRGNLAENRTANAGRARTDFIIGTPKVLHRTAIFDILIMNMLFTESAPLLDTLKQHLVPHAHCIWSGILAADCCEAVDAAGSHGFFLRSERTENEWWCGVFGRE